MRSRLALLSISLYLAIAVLGCSSKPAADSSTAASTDNSAQDSTGKQSAGNKEKREQEARREPLVLPAGTAITIDLASALGSKLSQPGQTFTGSVAKSVVVRSEVAIPKGANVQGTVVDAKPLGRFAGGAVLEVRLDSVDLKGSTTPVEAAPLTFSEKGKGKRTAVLTGGGAALGGIIGGLAGGGKGALIGAAAGGGAGAGGAAFTGNKDVVLPAESALTFELSKSLQVRQ